MVFSESLVVDFLKNLLGDAMVDLDACDEDVALGNGSLSKDLMKKEPILCVFMKTCFFLVRFLGLLVGGMRKKLCSCQVCWNLKIVMD